MQENPYASSLDTKIFSATPMELVKLLYREGIEAVQDARCHLSRGEIMERGRSVSRAVAVLAELSGSLDHEKGGDLSTQLAAIYDYLQRTLLEANFRQADDGLAQAERLLKTLNEAWSAIEAPRSAGSTESYPSSYSLAGNAARCEEHEQRVAQQWCA